MVERHEPMRLCVVVTDVVLATLVVADEEQQVLPTWLTTSAWPGNGRKLGHMLSSLSSVHCPLRS